MLMLLILLSFAYVQDNFGQKLPAYFWAIVFSIVNMGAVVVFGNDLPTAVFSSLILGVYAWGYFVVLRRFGEKVIWWVAICILGLLFPIALPFIFGQ